MRADFCKLELQNDVTNQSFEDAYSKVSKLKVSENM